MMDISNELLDHYAEYYTSEFTKKNMPWILETPSAEWLHRQLLRAKGDRGGCLDDT